MCLFLQPYIMATRIINQYRKIDQYEKKIKGRSFRKQKEENKRKVVLLSSIGAETYKKFSDAKETCREIV